MFKSLRSKVIAACIVAGFVTVLVFGQLGPLLRMPDGSEPAPGLSFYRNANTGFYLAGDGNMGMGFESMTFEGVTADAFETTLSIVDPTVDITYQFRDPLTADTYDVLAVPDADLTNSYFLNPLMGQTLDASIPADATAGDSEMIVHTVYLPFPMTVGAIYGISEAGGDTANDTGYLGAAIYPNTDAGVKLFTCSVADLDATAVVDCDGTDVVLHPGWYRVGFCSQNVSDQMWGGNLITESDVGVFLNQIPASTTWVAESANDCTGSSAEVPPTTTGALTDNASEIVFFAFGQD